MNGSFTPTHTVPPGGMAAWEAPDPSQPSVANLDAGLELQVVERYGEWAKAEFSNGWTAWVDGSLLKEIGSAPATGGVTTDWAEQYLAGQQPAPHSETADGAAGGFALSPALIPGFVIALSSVFPWFKFLGASINAFKIPVKYLTDPNSVQSTGGIFTVGLLILALGIGVTLLTVFPKSDLARRAMAGGALLIASVFVAQTQRAVSSQPADALIKVSLMSFLGFGVLVALAGALGAQFLKPKKAAQ